MPRQKLGQHFLSNPAWRQRIAQTLPADAHATWLEIGAGHGEMTELLAQRARRVIAIETDATLAATLRERAARSPVVVGSSALTNSSGSSGLPPKAAGAGAAPGWPNVEIVHADILSVDLATLAPNQFANEPHTDSSPPANSARNLGGRGFSPDINTRPVSGVSTPEDFSSHPNTASDRHKERRAMSKREARVLRQGTVSTVPKSTVMTGASAPEASLEPAKSTHEMNSTQRFRVYGNLPYYITSPILAHLFRFAGHIDSIHVVTQLEVAQRIAARPHSRNYGYLSTLCQYYAQPKILLRIPPGAFHPPPKVTSALIEMRLPGERAKLGIQNDAAFLKFLQACFAQKRKTLRNNLRKIYPHLRIECALAATALTDNSRAEELTLHQFAQLFLSLAEK